MKTIYENVRAVPQEAQKQILGGKLKGKTDINPMWRIKTLDQQFGMCGFGWYYEVKNKQIVDGANGEKAVFVDIAMYVNNDGEWSNPIYGTGGSMLINTEKGQLVTNDEAFKMATTDAISVACKQLGVGADIYWKEDKTKYTGEEKKAPIDEEKPSREMWQEAEQLGINVTGLQTYYKLPSIDCITKDVLSQAIATKKKWIEKQQAKIETEAKEAFPDEVNNG